MAGGAKQDIKIADERLLRSLENFIKAISRLTLSEIGPLPQSILLSLWLWGGAGAGSSPLLNRSYRLLFSVRDDLDTHANVQRHKYDKTIGVQQRMRLLLGATAPQLGDARP